MVGAAARLGRTAGTAVLAVVLSVASLACLWQVGEVRSRLTAEAADQARLVAQLRLAPLLSNSDLSAPVTGDRYRELSGEIRRQILGQTAVQRVTLWSATGRILYANDSDMVGTRPTFIRGLVSEVANGTTQIEVETGTLKTFVPVWRQPGGTVAVAELEQPFGPIAAAAGRVWYPVASGLAVVALGCWVRFAFSFRGRGARVVARPMATAPMDAGIVRPRAAQVVTGPAPSGRAAPGSAAAGPWPERSGGALAAAGLRGPVRHESAEPGLHDVEQARRQAEDRARTAEDGFRRLQAQHKQALDRLAAMEERLSAAAAAPRNSQEELRALRDQVRESAERLHHAEQENEQLRARLGDPGAIAAAEGAR